MKKLNFAKISAVTTAHHPLSQKRPADITRKSLLLYLCTPQGSFGSIDHEAIRKGVPFGGIQGHAHTFRIDLSLLENTVLSQNPCGTHVHNCGAYWQPWNVATVCKTCLPGRSDCGTPKRNALPAPWAVTGPLHWGSTASCGHWTSTRPFSAPITSTTALHGQLIWGAYTMGQ